MDIFKVNKILFNAHGHDNDDDLHYKFYRYELIQLLEEIKPGIAKEIFK